MLCPNCSSGLRFDPASQKLVCDHCDTRLDPEKYKNEYTKAEISDVEEKDGKYRVISYACPQCGGKLYTLDDTAVTFCSYCGTSVTLESRITETEKPKYIIPFTVSRQECEKSYRSLVARSLYAPSSLTKGAQIEKFRGIYMPYWVFSYFKKGKVKTNSTVSESSGNYIYKKYYSLEQEVNYKCEGISYDASRDFSDTLSGAVAPFDVKGAKKFNPAYLSGFYGDAGNVHSSLYEGDARKVVAEDFADQVMDSSRIYKRYDLDKKELLAQNLDVSEEKGMFPVWFLSTRNRKGDRISYAVVNGQTGKAVADLPIDFFKYLIGSILLSLPIFFLMNMKFTINPEKMLWIALFLAVLSILITNDQLKKIYVRENYLDDKGREFVIKSSRVKVYPRVENKAKRALLLIIARIISVIFGFFFLIAGGSLLVFLYDLIPWSDTLDTIFGTFAIFLMISTYLFSGWVFEKQEDRIDGSVKVTSNLEPAFGDKAKVSFKQVISIVISISVLVAQPVYDTYYYGAALISLLLVIASFYDIVSEHNRLTTRKLPQMEKRGGDENE